MPSEPLSNVTTSPPRKSKRLSRDGDESMETNDYGNGLKGILFENDTKAIVWGQQIKAVQVDMLLGNCADE